MDTKMISRSNAIVARGLSHFGWILAIVAPGAIASCSSSSNEAGPTDAGVVDAGDGGVVDPGDPFDVPITGIGSDLVAAFYNGDAEFSLVLRPLDGLGPLYTRPSCDACHGNAVRGPGLVQKMAIVEADDITPAADQSLLAFGNTEHPLVVTEIPGALTPILPPDLDAGIDGGLDADGGVAGVKVTIRIGPPVLGRGYMEAISDSEILRMETEQAARSDGIHGHVNHLTFVSQPNPDQTFDTHKTGDIVIGRFGLKARIATLDEFSADALQGDMGITSPMRPTEIKNPDGVLDDLKPGVDITADQMNARGMYVRLLAIPSRAPNDAGKALFEQCLCNVCHAESLKTRADYPIPQLANIDAPVYTDMLLHDMGDTLADSVVGGNEGEARARDWRTAPLIGLRFNRIYLHDGRASSIDDAVRKHDGPGSEASGSVQLYNALSPADQKALVDFVGAL